MTPTFLRSLQALELAIRTGSFAAAAERLAITPAAVGQRIKVIEDYLGMDLLVRGRSGIRPARQLEAAIPHLAAAFREIESAVRVLDFQRVHEIHILADQDFAELWLRPRLAAFQVAYPSILFCLNGVGDVPVRLGQADCEIRFGASGEDIEDRLFRDYMVPVGSPENTCRVSALPEDERLEAFPLLHLDCYARDPDAAGWPEWTSRFGHRKTAPSRGIRYAHVMFALAAVHSSAGMMICGASLVLDQLKSKQLVMPFPVSQGTWTAQAYHAAFRKDAMRRAQVARFRDWLLEDCRKTQSELDRFVAGG